MTTATLRAPRLSAARRARWTGVRQVLLRRPGRIIGLAILVFFTAMAVLGPVIYPGRLAVDPDAVYAPPSADHWLGTDFAGSDVFQEVVIGARYVLHTAAFAALITAVLGTGVGLVAGYHRGLTDSALMRLTDFVLTIPGFPLLIVLSTIWSYSSPTEMGLVLGLTGWGGVARAVRSQTLSLRERGFLEAARGWGCPAGTSSSRNCSRTSRPTSPCTCCCRSSASSGRRSACSSSASSRSPAATGASCSTRPSSPAAP
ncbi:hypothetical protein GCM10025734_73690 [Kitasatospora paranensis]